MTVEGSVEEDHYTGQVNFEKETFKKLIHTRSR
jgi:hypothetical protein